MPKMLYFLCILGFLLLSACSYDSEKAVKNGDVINSNGPVYNFPRFELFLDNIASNTPAFVRIANYPLEGKPTLYNLSFDGASIHLEIDRSKNNNSSEEPTKVNKTCKDLVMEYGQQVVTYKLEGCDQGSLTEDFILLTVLKEQEDEDEH